jgi:TRAP-type mannitol/chloroaromatic compound transport system permease small subunit
MEAVLRYAFNSPTIWVWDINGQIFTGAGILAGAYALRHDTHVRLDIVYRNWTPRQRTLADLISFPVVFVALCVVFWKGVDMFWWSFKTKEHAHSYFAPPIWPLKSCLFIAAFLMLLQSLSNYGRTLLRFIKLNKDDPRGTQ